ncbi:MAG TPA: LLM class flavin-dependent oxidoreductase [Thermomicrobiales bacterium]|nr:LLM class flavin-dependent oxidoreductase [Thermomicrobiales bacterium]
MTHDLRIGFWTTNGTPWDDLIEQWRIIEESGYDCTGFPDHLMPTAGSIDAPYMEGWTLLTALATLTPRLRVAVLVTGNTYRNPALLAKMATTLDHVTGGRVDLGLGAGWFEAEHTAFGYAFPSAGQRVEMLRESIAIIRSLMRGGRTTYDGAYYTIQDAPFAPLPVQEGGLPIMVGAQGPRMLRLVAACADTWNLNHSPVRMRELGALLNQECEAIGRDPRSVRWSAFSFPGVLDHDPLESVDTFLSLVRAYIDAGASEIAMRMPGPQQYDIVRRAGERLHELRDEYASRSQAH